MQVHELKCFGLRPGQGNAALVVQGDHAARAERQAFATRQGKHACVFVDPCDDGQAEFLVDYFYPHARSPLCMHATLGAASVLFARQGPYAPIRVRTAMRGQYLTLSRNADGMFIGLAPQAFMPPALAPGLPEALLDAPGIALASAPLVASVGSAKLLIEVENSARLHALKPNLGLIAKWSAASGVSGCYVYCRTGQDEYEGRNFNHLVPALEDSATGVAAGALTAHLQRGLTLFQGKATGQSCMIRTRLDGDAILIGGAAELIASYAQDTTS